MKQPLFPVNRQLAVLLNRIADCYRYLGPEQRFRAMAYSGAAQTLRNLSEPVESLAANRKALEDLKSIGPHIAEKIQEYLATGRMATFENLKKQVPFRLLELMDVEGIGPATLRQLHEKTGVETPEELVRFLRDGGLTKLSGFGPHRMALLRQALKMEETKIRYPLSQARSRAARLLKLLQALPGVEEAIIAGSIRRKKPTIGDIDIVLTAGDRGRKELIRRITSLPITGRVLAAGATRVSIVLKPVPVQADIRIVHPSESGAALFYFTGSKEHNIRIRSLARSKGWKMNEYGVFDRRTGKRLAGATEEEIYALFGLAWIPPEERTGEREFVKYAKRPAKKKYLTRAPA